MGLNAQAIGLKIQEARLTKGLTQDELANALGVSRSTVVRWETGKAVPRQIGIPKVAQTLGKDSAWLLEGSSDMNLQSQNVEILRAERRTLKEIRSEVKNLSNRLENQRQQKNHIVAHPTNTELPPPLPSRRAIKTRNQHVSQQPSIDRKALEDIQRAWNNAKPEARLIAALLVTGDWAYKLKLWNREVSVDQEVLSLLGSMKASS